MALSILSWKERETQPLVAREGFLKAQVDALLEGGDWVPGGTPGSDSQRSSRPAPTALGAYSQRENSPNPPRLKVFFSCSLGGV